MRRKRQRVLKAIARETGMYVRSLRRAWTRHPNAPVWHVRHRVAPSGVEVPNLRWRNG